ncbi:MAG: hypothetical protein ACRD2S_02655, partial [Terriglobales bacterium]
MIFKVNAGNTTYRIKLERDGQAWRCELDGQLMLVQAQLIRDGVMSLIANGQTYEIKRDQLGNQVRIWIKN